jgi:hypothetical protein
MVEVEKDSQKAMDCSRALFLNVMILGNTMYTVQRSPSKATAAAVPEQQAVEEFCEAVTAQDS